jgi:Protein of unknown function (DUF3570)
LRLQLAPGRRPLRSLSLSVALLLSLAVARNASANENGPRNAAANDNRPRNAGANDNRPRIAGANDNRPRIADARPARARRAAPSARAPKLVLERPADGDLDVVLLDGATLPLENLGRPMTVTVGRHVVHAEGTVDDQPASFDREFTAAEREAIAIRIVLVSTPGPAAPAAGPLPPSASPLPRSATAPAASERGEPAAAPATSAKYLTGRPMDFLQAAASSDEVRRSRPPDTSNIVARVTIETGGYSDTNHVNVLSPSLHASIDSPTAGWNVAGSYAADMVSAASPDIVSEASPPFHEVRHAGMLTGGYKPRLFGVQATGDFSTEPDYLSLGAGLSFTADLDDKLVTPTLAVHYSHDTIGRSTTPFSVFHHNLDTTEVELGATFVMSRTSIIHLGATLQVELGDQSKPYRYVPLFDPAVAAQVVPGQSIASVNLARESLRPLEQLPTERERYALGARFVHRFPGATLRLEERIYADSWRQLATTSDLRFVVDLGPRIRFWPHGRVNAQTGTSFYRLAYSPIVDPVHNHLAVPIYRTGDRELSPSIGVTGGGGLRVLLTTPGPTDALALTLQVDALYTRYVQSLFETSRTGLYGTLGVEGEFE